MSHTQKRITNLYSPGERCNHQRWWSLTTNVTSTSLFVVHAPCVSDEILLLVSGGRNVRGREKFVKEEEKEKIRTNRKFVRVVDRVL